MLAQKVKESEITEQDSLLLTGNLLRIPIFNISYISGLFPEKYFNDKSVPALEMKIMDAESRRLIDWMEKGVYDALQKKYLRTLLFCICERVDGLMIEEYAFSFNYLNSDSQEVSMNINRKGSKKGATINCNSKAEITPSQMRSSACKMVRTLSQLMRTLDNIPEEHTILMKLLYYDDVKPVDYEPPFFRGCIEEAAVNIWTRSPLKMEVGNVNRKHFALALKGVLDHCEDENDDYQNDVSLGDENSESDSETGNLLRIPIFNRSYISGLFPEKYFNDKSVPALEMKIMDAESRRLIDWMEKGVYDALQKKYLRTLLFCICERVDGLMIEEYAFSFNYLNSDSQEVSMNINRKGSKKGATINCNSKAEITPSQMRSSACKMVRTLSQLMRTLDNIPEEHTILMKLLYYDDVKPVDYEPPFFRGCIEEAAVNIWTRSPLKMEVGNVNRKHFALALKGVLDHCEDENDDYQNDVSLGDENSESDSETGNLLRIPIFNRSYISGLFPEKYFNDKSVPALEMKIMDAESRRLIDWMEKGVYDALQKKYLRTTTSRSTHSSLFSLFTPIRHPRVPSRTFSTEVTGNLVHLFGCNVINTPYMKFAIAGLAAAALSTAVKKAMLDMAHDGLLGVLRGKQYQLGDVVEFNGKVGKIIQKSNTQICVVFEAESGGMGACELFRNTETKGLRNITLWERFKVDSKKRIERRLWWEGFLRGAEARELKAEELFAKQRHLYGLPFKHCPSQK